jgi:transcriptional regulator of arginine metabolism
MVSKQSRLARILEIVKRNPVGSQERLASLLREAGIRVTQSTLSRDIRELGLVKVRGRYQAVQSAVPPAGESIRRSLQQLVVHSGVSGNILMVRTGPGNAHSLGAVLDAVQWPEVLGTVAGDDTVFVLLRSTREGKKVLRRIQEYSA